MFPVTDGLNKTFVLVKLDILNYFTEFSLIKWNAFITMIIETRSFTLVFDIIETIYNYTNCKHYYLIVLLVPGEVGNWIIFFSLFKFWTVTVSVSHLSSLTSHLLRGWHDWCGWKLPVPHNEIINPQNCKILIFLKIDKITYKAAEWYDKDLNQLFYLLIFNLNSFKILIQSPNIFHISLGMCIARVARQPWQKIILLFASVNINGGPADEIILSLSDVLSYSYCQTGDQDYSTALGSLSCLQWWIGGKQVLQTVEHHLQQYSVIQDWSG